MEDDGAVARSIERILRSVGFDVLTCLSGVQALERLRQGARFHLVVSDIQMPDLDGPGFGEAARKCWPEIDRVLVYVTGGSHEQVVGPIRCFEKPLRREFLDYVGEAFAQGRAAMGT